jgi:hypothetical protein
MKIILYAIFWSAFAAVCEHLQLSRRTFGLVPEARFSSGPVVEFVGGFAYKILPSFAISTNPRLQR